MTPTDLPARYTDDTPIDEAWLRTNCDKCESEHRYYFGPVCVEACMFHWNINTSDREINGGLSYLKSRLDIGTTLHLLAALGWRGDGEAPQTL